MCVRSCVRFLLFLGYVPRGDTWEVDLQGKRGWRGEERDTKMTLYTILQMLTHW